MQIQKVIKCMAALLEYVSQSDNSQAKIGFPESFGTPSPRYTPGCC